MNFGPHIGYSCVVSFYHKEIHRSDMSSAARKGRQFHTGGCAKLMEVNVLSKMSYGMYILSSKYRDRSSACVVDACIQAGSDPSKVLVSVMHKNFTRKVIEKSGVFCLAILAENCPFEMIKHFGYQTSRNVDKFDGLTTFTDINGVPCLLSYVCASISVRVTDIIDIGSHTVFIGKVKDQKLLTNAMPMTYAYYQANVKPKDLGKSADADKKIVAWRCTVCGFVYNDPVLPDDYLCPVCGQPSSDFVPVYE